MDSDTFRIICRQKCSLEINEPVLVGFSGGADSLSLLILLNNAGFNVTAAHFNHHLRDAAGTDELRARELAGALDIRFISGAADVKKIAINGKLSIEEAARQTRYQWLFEQAEKFHVKSVAVGHTADDQIETLLMHLIRGAGLDGLLGMTFRQILPIWHTEIPVVRPLLTFWREQTEEICSQAGLVPVNDETNFSSVYFRNRIRLELIPYLRDYNPKVKQHLFQTTQILKDEAVLLQEIKDKAWTDCFDQRTDNWLAFLLKKIREQPAGIKQSLLRRAVLELDPSMRDLDFVATTKLIEFMENPGRSGGMQLPGKLWVQVENDRLVFWTGKPGFTIDAPQIQDGNQLFIGLNETMDLADWKLSVADDALESARTAIRGGGNSNIVWLDKEKLNFPLTIRGYLPGERFTPLGMSGKTIKVSDFWVNRKIPRPARKNWPIVYSGQSIVWIASVAISESAAITSQTRQVIRISLQNLSRRTAG